ncbi:MULTISPECIES: PaaI family thioesterase [Rhodobacterales]|uniref:PaaI family thioesterase n=1 Tax=Cognatishimia coralii TaxID=3083254 RepID=A0ABU8QKE3_9RHOB|nr:PaaI family thioesterase [Shimia aestuarii]
MLDNLTLYEHLPEKQFQHLSAQFAREPAYRYIGLKLRDLRRGFCATVTTVSNDLHHHRGAVQGGIIAMIADATAGYTALASLDVEAMYDDMATIEFKTSFFRPGAAKELICVSNLVHGGNRTLFCAAKIYLDEIGDNQLCADATLTFSRLRSRA